MENEQSNMGEYINCYNNLTGYYLDIEDSLFKKCFDTCETCEIKGDNKTHNCLECNIYYPFSITVNHYSNCYENCTYYYFFDEELNYFCTDDSSCPEEYPLLIQEKRECVKSKEYPTTIIINEEYSSTNFENYISDNKDNTQVKSEINIESQIINNNNINIMDNINDILNQEKNETKKGKKEENKYYNKILQMVESIILLIIIQQNLTKEVKK